MTAKQKRFCYEYMTSGNATQSALNSGYAEKTARSQGQRLRTLPSVQKMLTELAKEIENQKIAKAKEMQERLTQIIRGEVLEDVIVVLGTGDGKTKAITVQKKPSNKDVIKAIETLAKMQGLFKECNVINVVVPVFQGENELED